MFCTCLLRGHLETHLACHLHNHSRKAVPTGVTTGLDIGFSNLSLKLITLSFYSKWCISGAPGNS